MRSMLFQINFVEFWNKFGNHFGLSLSELTYRNHYCFRDKPEIEEELGLEVNGSYLNVIYFKVVDEQKFFLAKIKYGI